MTDLRKAAEMALNALYSCEFDYDWEERPYKTFDEDLRNDAVDALRKALAQDEQVKRVCNTCDGTGMAKGLHNWKGGGKKNQPCWACHEVADEKKEPALGDTDPRLLLGKSNDFTKETGNRLCDIERRLAAIETQSDEANKKPHAVSYKDGVPVAYYNFDPPPYTVPPSKPWVSLTDEDFDNIYKRYDTYDSFARAIVAKLKEKNT